MSSPRKNVIPLFLLPEFYYNIICKFYRGLKYHTIYNFLERHKSIEHIAHHILHKLINYYKTIIIYYLLGLSGQTENISYSLSILSHSYLSKE